MNRGENTDTTQSTATGPENTGDWSAWAIRHLPEIRVLKAAGILGSENKNWRNISEHLLVVNATAVYLARKLVDAGQTIDLETVDKASILHDATKRLEKERGVSYASEHSSSIRRDFLEQFGYSPDIIAAAEYTGRVPEMFIEDPEEQKAAISAIPLERSIVAYADARVRNTEIVSLETARDLNKQKVPSDAAIYDQWYSFYRNVWERIINTIDDPDFTPQSINNSSVTAMVIQAGHQT